MMYYSAREYAEVFQLVFFQKLMERIEGRSFAVKGGGCLRFFHGSPRLSKDIDFDIGRMLRHTLKDNVESILSSQNFARALLQHGIADYETNIPDNEPTETSGKWKIMLITESGEEISTRAEFSLRKNPEEIPYRTSTVDSVLTEQYGLDSFEGQHYTKPTMLKQKIKALSDLSRWAIRDGFDIHFLLKQGVDVPADVTAKELDEVIDSLEHLGWSEFQGEVLPYLEEDVREKYDSERKFWMMLDDIQTKFTEALVERDSG